MLPTSMDRFVDATAPAHDPIQAEMADYAAEHGFPIIGRAAGSVLRGFAHARRAASIFEFGSGFGYSATWFLDGLDADGTIVLTEVDADEIALAKEYLSRAGETDRVRFEHGDAMDTINRYDGPFDIVLIDHQKSEYTEAFKQVREKVPVGGVIIADNVMDGPVWYEDLLPYLETDDGDPDNENAAGIITYLRTVRNDPAWHTVVLPIGKGLAVSTRTL